jgi:hypothetical protein
MNKEQLELRIKEELLKDSNRSNTAIAVAILGKEAKHNEVESLRQKVGRFRKRVNEWGQQFENIKRIEEIGYRKPNTDILLEWLSKTPEEEFTNSHIEAMKKAGIEVKVRNPEPINFDKLVKDTAQQYVDYLDKKHISKDFNYNIRNYNPDNVLVIPCLHLPFSTKAHLQHCVDVKEKYNCGKVIFLGDIIDNHYSSFHENNPDGYSAKEELELVKEHLKLWKQAFPEAVWILGNHDKIPERKVFSSGLSKQWLKSYNEVLDVNWEYRKDYVYNGVYYCHGEAMTAKTLAGKIGMPVVQAHRHSEYYIQYLSQKIWGMQTGVIFDKSKYAFAYAKESTQTWVEGCAVVEGNKPHLIAM